MIKNEELIRQYAPAAFATAPEDGRVSERYSFLPTTDIIKVLQEEGWTAHKAEQVKSRIWSREHAKHLIRFKHESLNHQDFGVGDSFPEMLLINCHNGLGAYTLAGGIFRLVCTNGMVVSSQDFGTVKARHIGFEPAEILNASRKVIEEAPNISDIINRWSEIELDKAQQDTYVRETAHIRFGANVDESILQQLNMPRRNLDMGNDLWTTFNRVQENTIRGGFQNSTTRRKVRTVTNIDLNRRINNELWSATSDYAQALLN